MYKGGMDGWMDNPHTDLPSMLCLIFVDQIHQEKPEKQKNNGFLPLIDLFFFTSMHLKIYSQVVSKVVFIKSVGLKAMWCCVKIVTSDATYEALCLHRNQQ